MPPADPPIMVFIMILAGEPDRFANISRVLLPLKKSHETHRMKVPRTMKTSFWGLNSQCWLATHYLKA